MLPSAIPFQDPCSTPLVRKFPVLGLCHRRARSAPRSASARPARAPGWSDDDRLWDALAPALAAPGRYAVAEAEVAAILEATRPPSGGASSTPSRLVRRRRCPRARRRELLRPARVRRKPRRPPRGADRRARRPAGDLPLRAAPLHRRRADRPRRGGRLRGRPGLVHPRRHRPLRRPLSPPRPPREATFASCPIHPA